MFNIDEFIKRLDDNSQPTAEAAIYARVSTKNEGQKESCANQVKSATEYAKTKKNIHVSEDNILIDDGYSGKSVTKRKNYQVLMKKVELGLIKLIIAKTSSRLFRSVIESQNFMTALLKNNVVLYTLDEARYWDFNNFSDITMFTFNSVMNAGVSKTQSDAGHGSQKSRIRDCKLWPKDIITGYKWTGKDITIDKEFAPYVVEIFKEYVYRNATPASICRNLKEKGIKFPYNKKDNATKESHTCYRYISERTISTILTNEKYIGKFTINKRSSTFIPGEDSQRYILPEEDWVVIERPDLKIVDTELFELAQSIRKARINVFKPAKNGIMQARFQGTNTFATKVKCSICGKNYICKKPDSKYAVTYYYHPKHDDCPDSIKNIYEPDLEAITKQALKLAIGQAGEITESLEKALKDAVKKSQDNGSEITKLKKELANKEQQRENTFKLTTGEISAETFAYIQSNLETLSGEIKVLKDKINDKETNRLNDSYISDTTKKISDAIDRLKDFTTIDRNRVQNYIDKIELYPNGDIEIFLSTGQVLLTVIGDSDTDNTNNGSKILLTEFEYEKSVRTPKRKFEKELVTVRCYLQTYPPSTPSF